MVLVRGSRAKGNNNACHSSNKQSTSKQIHMVLNRRANIIITGTPGVGKSSHVQLLKEHVPQLTVVDVKDVAKENNCFIGYDEERKSQIVDEERVVDALENQLDEGNLVIDWHVCDAFPEQKIDLVVVLRTENGILYDRLKARGYDDKKITENIDAEIMEIVLNDAREQYDEDIIVELESNKSEDVQSNVERIAAWLENWNDDHPKGIPNTVIPESDSSDSSDDEREVPALQAKKRAEEARKEAEK